MPPFPFQQKPPASESSHCVQRPLHSNPKSVRMTKRANSGRVPSTTSRARQEAGNTSKRSPPTAYNVSCTAGRRISPARLSENSVWQAPRRHRIEELRCHAPSTAKSIANVIYVNTFRSVWYSSPRVTRNPDRGILNCWQPRCHAPRAAGPSTPLQHCDPTPCRTYPESGVPENSRLVSAAPPPEPVPEMFQIRIRKDESVQIVREKRQRPSKNACHSETRLPSAASPR